MPGQLNTQPSPGVGRLIIASSHIGCVTDIPQRSLEAVRTCDILLVEEAKPARRVLKAAGIHREFLRFNEHTAEDLTPEVTKKIKGGKTVCLLSDQGMPNLADPGLHLVDSIHRLKLRLEVIPGPSSITCALAACPFPHEQFLYTGFLPKTSQARMESLNRIKNAGFCSVVLDTPYRRSALLEDCSTIFSPSHRAMLAVEIGSTQEAYPSGTFKELIQWSTQHPQKLNFVLIISGKIKGS